MEFQPAQRRAPKHPRYDAIHRALLTGLLSNVGMKTETHEYQGPRGVKFSIFPGSALFKSGAGPGQRPKWIVAGELVETTKLYARINAGVQPQWIERAAQHLVERTHSDPRWDAQSGSAIATEKVTLFGLVLIPARPVPYGPINPRVARELFIQHALVLGDLRTPAPAPFLRHNAALVEEVQTLEAKIRQRNLLADQATRYGFFDARVPLDVYDAKRFDQWRRAAERANPRLLFLSKEDLLRADAPAITAENYPDRLSDAGGGLKLPVQYCYEPGEANDGLTVTVPVAALLQLRPERYEWMVPGMLEEKVGMLLRNLPGALRRNFVPVPEWAKAASAALLASGERDANVSLKDALAAWLGRQSPIEVRGSDFAQEELPPYLRMAFRVVDNEGRVLAYGRDLPGLQRKLAPRAADTLLGIGQQHYRRDHVRAWDFGDLPESVTVQRFGMTIVGHPALVDAGEDAAIRLLPSAQMAEAAHRAGVRRLFAIERRREVKALAATVPEFASIALKYWLLGPSSELREDLLTLILDQALFGGAPALAAPRTLGAYETARTRALERLPEMRDAVAGLVNEILQQNLQLALVREDQSRAFEVAATDVRDQLVFLLPRRFLLDTPYASLEQIPRYLAAMRVRLEKLAKGGAGVVERDMEAMASATAWHNQYLARKERLHEMGIHDAELQLFRWMLEEYRVSLFAQELGTVMPISERRLEKQWEKVRKA
ncbi:MAG TPA: DUF3418 domain-containing protein [Phycisphaerae bacterium]|nr:DUF3418 domain-containing protein [Phycisphaerae bacterium]